MDFVNFAPKAGTKDKLLVDKREAEEHVSGWHFPRDGSPVTYVENIGRGDESKGQSWWPASK